MKYNNTYSKEEKDFLNRKENSDGTLTIKLIKMGCDIDEENNHRVRGIIPTEDGKYLFVEVSSGNRFEYNKNNFPTLSKSDYLERYPYEKYLYCDSCFRIDIPEDYCSNYTKEFSDYDRKCLYKINYNKDGIIKFLQNFNKNIKNIELVNDYYIDDYCKQHGFYKLYDNNLKHSLNPLKITHMNDRDLTMDVLYTCYNYDDSVEYNEEMNIKYRDYNRNELDKLYGRDVMNTLIENYEKHFEELRSLLKKDKESEEMQL